MMFVLGCFAEERGVPIGASFDHRGVMPDHPHDAVGVQLMIPIGRTQAGGHGTATSGAPQPAADAQAETDDGMSEPCWDGDTSQDSQAEELAERLREVEEDDDVPKEFQLELGSILFKKKWVTDGGVRRQYVATRAEINGSIKKLLKRRRQFMADNGLHDPGRAPDGASQPVGASGSAAQADGRPYVFNLDQRAQLMRLWKDPARNGWVCEGRWYSDGDHWDASPQELPPKAWSP